MHMQRSNSLQGFTGHRVDVILMLEEDAKECPNNSCRYLSGKPCEAAKCVNRVVESRTSIAGDFADFVSFAVCREQTMHIKGPLLGVYRQGLAVQCSWSFWCELLE